MSDQTIQVIHKGQHLLRHKAQDINYTNPANPSVINVKAALDDIYSSLGTTLNWKESVANKASLPLTGNTVNDARVVQDDGDGKAAIYVCIATTGTVDLQWLKIADVDWQGAETVNITNADSPYTASLKNTILVNTSGGAVTINLPAVALSTDKTYYIKKTTNDVNQITISPSTAETIDGSTTKVIGQYLVSMKIVSDGSSWHII